MIKDRFSEITIATLPPSRVACFRAVSRTPEEDALKVLTQWAAGVGIRGLPRNFGFDTDVSPAAAEAGLRGYELWFAVPAGVLPSGPVSIRDFPGGCYAVLTIRDPFDDPFRLIPAGWGVLHEWVITHGYEQPGETLGLEEIVERDGARDLLLYHPVRGDV